MVSRAGVDHELDEELRVLAAVAGFFMAHGSARTIT